MNMVNNSHYNQLYSTIIFNTNSLLFFKFIEDELDPEEETLPSFDSIANAENDDEEV